MQPRRIEIRCDGCGLTASPEHIAARLRRLELSTRFRPVHIGVLFVGFAPESGPHADFYGSEPTAPRLVSFLDTLEIPPAEHATAGASSDQAAGPAEPSKLIEFQRCGYFLAYLSECPLPAEGESTTNTITRLGPTLVRRIQLNYRPKAIALLGEEMTPVADVLRSAGLDSSLLLNEGTALPWPRAGDLAAIALFQKVLAGAAPRSNPAGAV
jgi:hypothetical protein